MLYLYLYLLLINAVSFLIMLLDKHRARKKLWRIPERILIGFCIIGGSLGGFLAMHLLRHKTRHLRFALGIPALLIAHLLLLVLLPK